MKSNFAYFDDEGNEINADLVPKPQLCSSCKKNDEHGMEEILCNLTGLDQRHEEEFICYAYEQISK
jgi:hypothetical protein